MHKSPTTLMSHAVEEHNPTSDMPKEADHLDIDELDPHQRRIAKGLILCICFAANVGGTGTITGTPPNLVMVGQVNENLYRGEDTGLTFASWMTFATLPMVIIVAIVWLVMAIYYLGVKNFFLNCKCQKGRRMKDAVERLIEKKYKALPPWSFAEVTVLGCFGVLLILWIFRDPKPLKGFSVLFSGDVDKQGKPVKYFTDATSAVLIALLLFAIPEELPDFLCFRSRDKSKAARSRKPLMDWPTMQAQFPWSVVILLGGGLALAGGVRESGLSAWLGFQLRQLASLPLVGIQFICVLLTMAVTNITSNTVTCSIFVPIVNRLALELGVNPLALIIPVTLGASFAFVLPVGTPPNAIVFASGILAVKDMATIGSLITVVTLVLTVVLSNTYISAILSLDSFPSWALSYLPDRELASTLAGNTTLV